MPSRREVIETVLASVYCKSREERRPTVEALAAHLDKEWDAIMARAERYGPEDRVDYTHEVRLVIWNWFPGGGTAEIAARRVMEAVGG